MFTKVCPNPECPDIELFGVQGSYGDEIDLCAKCGTRLIRQSAEALLQQSPPFKHRRLVALCAPRTSAELAIIKSVLRAERIYFFVHNEFFGLMHVGVSIPLVNQRTILVAEEDLAPALELVTLPETFEPAPPYRYGALDKVRMIIEALAFGWVLPGRRSRFPE